MLLFNKNNIISYIVLLRYIHKIKANQEFKILIIRLHYIKTNQLNF